MKAVQEPLDKHARKAQNLAFTNHLVGNNNNEKDIIWPEYSSELAEFVGIVLGDGCVSDYSDKHSGVRSIRIAGHLNERSYLFGYVSELCNKLFGEYPREYYHNTRKAVYLHLCGKQYVEFVNSIGLKSGNKIDNKQGVPEWIFEKEEYMMACLRGLIDTDGSIYRMDKWVQMCYRCHCPELLRSTQRLFRELGFYISEICRKKIYLSRKAEIRNYFNSVGFANSKHVERYERFTSPVV